MAALVLFLLIVVVSLLAPVYASHIAHTNPFVNNLNGTTVVHGKRVPLMQQGGGALKLGETPIGPTWDVHHYFLGADAQGRDVAARLLYGGRSALLIGIGSAVICCIIATVLALIAGFFGGVTDSLLSRLMDVIWAFPVLLFAITVGTELLTLPHGLQVGPLQIVATSLWPPHLIIAFIYVPYVYRPVRGQVLTVVHREYVEALISQGASNLRLLFSRHSAERDHGGDRAAAADHRHHDPHRGRPVVPWGRGAAAQRQVLRHDHQRRLEPVYTRPWVLIAPGIMIVLTVLALNVLGDGVRDALDPRAKLRVGESDAGERRGGAPMLTFIVRRLLWAVSGRCS